MLNRKGVFLLEGFFVVIIYLFLYDYLYPLKVFMTLIHESMHGIMALSTGGGIKEIVLNGEEGVTYTYGGSYTLISLFGYLGLALVGGALIGSHFRALILFVFYIFISIILFVYTKVSIEFVISLLFMIVSFIVFYKYKSFREHFSFIFGTFLAMQSIKDIRNYLVEIPEKTDSALLANYIGMPILTVFISIFMVFITFLIYFTAIKFFLLDEEEDI